MSRLDETKQAKLEKRAELEKRGTLAHPYSFAKTHTIAAARETTETTVALAGRIMGLRTHGKVTFIDLQDSSGNIQVMMKQDEIPAEKWELLAFIDRGDFLGAFGVVGTSRTGETTLMTKNFEFLGKALRPLPTEWNAAEDKEARFRQRYLDMLINPETRRVLDARWLIEKEIRRYMQDNEGFTEVETPVFHPLYGGTNAKPFTTHMLALDSDFYLRLAPELYLKRLIVGGYDKVFEIARNFRNEGIDQTHQPEFTMMEWYETYADYARVMDVAEGLLKHLIDKLHQSTAISVGEHTVETSGSWPRITMKEVLLEKLNLDFDATPDNALQTLLQEHKIELIGEFTRGKVLFALFDKLVASTLITPIWIIDYPRDISPLSKAHRTNPELAERFELYIGGRELMDGWSEITDSVDQRAIWENEQRRMRAGDDEAHLVDEDFLEAMEYGMPPLGGIGVGIDRLVMFLTNTWSIREVIPFPTLRPLHKPKKTPTDKSEENYTLPPRTQAQALLETHVTNDALRHHCHMVARALEAYAHELGEDTELWYQTGLLHDLDWETHPDEHPNHAITELLAHYPQAMRGAIAAHAPDRTGKAAETLLERYLFACDELSGLMHAASLMRPSGFSDMEPKSIKKKLKDKAFAANVSRADITQGMELIGKTPDEHIGFLINVFKEGST